MKGTKFLKKRARESEKLRLGIAIVLVFNVVNDCSSHATPVS